MTAHWDNTTAGDNNSDVTGVTMDFSQFGGPAAKPATDVSGVWTASYTLAAGSIDTTNRNVSVTATNTPGNSTTKADSSNLTVDNQLPVVTDANITIASTASGTSGAYRVGDTVTAHWNNATGGDNNADIATVNMNFTQFGGGAAVAATQTTAGSNIWTASYTIVAGSIDSTNLNVVVTAVNDVGNFKTTADSSNLSMDDIVPVVTDPHISIVSTGSGTSGAYKVGSTVTAHWDNTSAGDNNADIATVTMDFSQFGGGAAVTATQTTAGSNIWTASYTLVAGTIAPPTETSQSRPPTTRAMLRPRPTGRTLRSTISRQRWSRSTGFRPIRPMRPACNSP